MSTSLAVILGIAAGFALATLLVNDAKCCATLGRAGLAKYGLPDLGTGVDSVFGGAISQAGLA